MALVTKRGLNLKRSIICFQTDFTVTGIFYNQILTSQRVLLDAYARRHEAQKIYLRQEAAQRWIGWREHTLQGERPHAGHAAGLANCDAALQAVSSIPHYGI